MLGNTENAIAHISIRNWATTQMLHQPKQAKQADNAYQVSH